MATFPSRSSAGEEEIQEEGSLAVLLRAVRFFCMESQVYLGREMHVATRAYMFGWCSYTPEPILLETCVIACALGGGQPGHRAVPHGAVAL